MPERSLRRTLRAICRSSLLTVSLVLGASSTPAWAFQEPAPTDTKPVGQGAITGRVVDAETGTPLPGVLVTVQSSAATTTTGADGRFQLRALAAGTQTLFVSLVGYGLARPTVDVPAPAGSDLVIRLSAGTATYTEEVTVEADRFRGTTSAVPAQQALSSGDMLNLRGVLTDDPFRAVQALPGVANGNDFRSDFSVRGSDARHIGLSIDGVATRWPVHAVRDKETSGSIALLNGDILDDVTLSAGSYPQDRPGRLGAWLDFSIRDGSRARRQVHGALSMTSASVVFEGPIGASKRGSWLVSARKSYLQWVLHRIDPDTGTQFGFSDTQARIVFDATPRQQFHLTLVAGHSKLDDHDDHPDANSLSTGTANASFFSVGWRSTFGGAVVLDQSLTLGGSGFHNEGELTGELADGSASETAYRAVLSWNVQPHVTVRTGGYVQHQRDRQDLTEYIQIPVKPFVGTRVDMVDHDGATASTHARITWTSQAGAILDGGVFVSRFAVTSDTTTSPWVLGSLPLGSRVTLRAGGGLYQQFPELSQAFGSFAGPQLRHERARDLDAGMEYRSSPAVRWQVTLYDREERDGLRLEGDETRLVDGTVVLAVPDPVWHNALDGSSRGVEVEVQRRASIGLSGWIGYAYGRTRYHDVVTGETYWGDADQRHTFNAYGQYRLSTRTGLSAKLRVGSNFPIPGYLQEQGTNPDVMFAAATRNNVRVPTYSRLDLRANHTYNFSTRRLTLFVELLNVLARKNYAPSDGTIVRTGEAYGFRDSLFPFLPSVGLIIDF